MALALKCWPALQFFPSRLLLPRTKAPQSLDFNRRAAQRASCFSLAYQGRSLVERTEIKANGIGIRINFRLAGGRRCPRCMLKLLASVKLENYEWQFATGNVIS